MSRGKVTFRVEGGLPIAQFVTRDGYTGDITMTGDAIVNTVVTAIQALRESDNVESYAALLAIINGIQEIE